MRREDDRNGCVVECGEDRLQSVGVVGVVRSVDRRERVVTVESEPSERVRPLARDRRVVETRVDDRVSGPRDARLDPLAREVPDGAVGRCEQQFGEVIRDDAVHLLGHRAVAAPQSGLDVADEHVAFRPGERRREDGVRITEREHSGRLVRGDLGVDADEPVGGLFRTARAPDFEIPRRLRQSEHVEEVAAELVVVVLAGVEQSRLRRRRRIERANHGSHLHELGTRADDGEHGHHVNPS